MPVGETGVCREDWLPVVENFTLTLNHARGYAVKNVKLFACNEVAFLRN